MSRRPANVFKSQNCSGTACRKPTSNSCNFWKSEGCRSNLLEDKHRYIQGALEHYQEQQVLQRDQELKRHDAQVQHLQGELRMVQEQLVSKREELSQLYRDLERISGEQAQQHKDARHLEQTLHTVQELAQGEQQKHQHATEQLQTLTHQVIRLQEKAKHQLLKQR